MIMRVAVMVVVALALAAAPALVAAPVQVDRGMKVYADQKCSLCHSIADKGNKKGPLDSAGSKLSADDMRKWIVSPKEMTEKTKATRKPPMKAYPSLAAEDVDALVAYLLTLKK